MLAEYLAMPPFGRLKVIGHGGYHVRPDGKRMSLLECRCECGETVKVAPYNLRGLKTKSCGCLQKDTVSNLRWKGSGELSGYYVARLKVEARKRGFQFDLRSDYLWGLFLSQDKKCALSGVSLRMAPKYDKSQTASLDRIDGAVGYVEGNVRWVHKEVNLMRNKLTDEQLLKWCSLIVKHNKIQNG